VGKEQQIRAQHPRDGAAGPDHRNLRGQADDDLGTGRPQAAEEVEESEPNLPMESSTLVPKIHS
jgi:hypothetical protein